MLFNAVGKVQKEEASGCLALKGEGPDEGVASYPKLLKDPSHVSAPSFSPTKHQPSPWYLVKQCLKNREIKIKGEAIGKPHA